MKSKKLSIIEVPCNGCTLCCQGDIIKLEDEEMNKGYLTEPHPFIPGALMLAHKSNGECIYLDGDRCSIHDTAPSLCRFADCRVIARRLSFEEAMQLHKLNKLDIRVWDKGRQLNEQAIN